MHPQIAMHNKENGFCIFSYRFSAVFKIGGNRLHSGNLLYMEWTAVIAMTALQAVRSPAHIAGTDTP